MVDFMTERGAHELARRIAEYWTVRGRVVRVRVVRVRVEYGGQCLKGERNLDRAL
jgi:hypothetical protein